jgi:hypothetical protein
MRGIAGTYRFRPSPGQLKFIDDFGRSRSWQGFWGGDLVGPEHRTARALERGRYLVSRFDAKLEAWRYEWADKAKKEGNE